MANNQYLNKTGLQYFYERLKTIFAKQVDLTALEQKVDDLVTSGGEPNKIDSISVNGTAVTPDANKNVDITVPTKTSELTNDSKFATEDYVDKNGGKIDTVKVNGTAQPITDKAIDITVPTKLSELTNDGDYVKDASYVHTDTNYNATDKGKVDKLVFNGNVLDDSILPSYVDDVVEVFPVGSTELASDWLSLTAGGSALTPASGKIYVLMADSENYAANSQFRFGGTTYVKLSDGGVSAITTAEIDTIVDA